MNIFSKTNYFIFCGFYKKIIPSRFQSKLNLKARFIKTILIGESRTNIYLLSFLQNRAKIPNFLLFDINFTIINLNLLNKTCL